MADKIMKCVTIAGVDFHGELIDENPMPDFPDWVEIVVKGENPNDAPMCVVGPLCSDVSQELDAEQFHAEMKAAATEYADATVAAGKAFGERVDAASNKAGGIPEIMRLASLNEAAKIIQAVEAG